METSILQQIRKKTGKFFEQQLLKTGRVLDVRFWESETIIEIDLHLPLVDMRLWNQVPYIKMRVGNLSFRDYTPFGWDAETATCSLLIDVTHSGQGSNWAKQLQKGDQIQYLKIESSQQAPHPTNLVVGLGDASSMAHLLALRQLTLPNTRFDGAILLNSSQTGELFSDYFSSHINTLTSRDELSSWLQAQGYCTAHTWFYLTGNHRLVMELRRLLKRLGHANIRVKGFWH